MAEKKVQKKTKNETLGKVSIKKKVPLAWKKQKVTGCGVTLPSLLDWPYETPPSDWPQSE